MPTPVTPNDFKELVPGPGASLCQRFSQFLLNFPTQFYNWFFYAYDENGEWTDAYKADLCAAFKLSCDCKTTTGGGGDTEGDLPTPQNVVATNGDFNDKIRVSWDSVSGAKTYEIWRGENPDLFTL